MVAGQSVDQAKKTLTNAGFKIGQETEVYSTEVESGKVVGTNPEAGQKAKKGSTVSISVSKGTEQVSVPDLRGMTKDQVKRPSPMQDLRLVKATLFTLPMLKRVK